MKIAHNEPTPEEVIKEVIYGVIEGSELIATLYLPKDKSVTLRPSVVYLHGGGWSQGTRKQFFRQAAAMASKGFVGLCIDYRLSIENQYPASIQDAKCAVRYLRANAEQFSLDPDRIGAVGGSAGAHLSACLATTGGGKKLEWEGTGGHQEYDSSIQAAVLFNGVFDLQTWWDYGKYNKLMTEFLEKPYDKDPELYYDASPVNHVDSRTCACLLIHGEDDEAVPISQSINFHNRILSVGGHSEIIKVLGVGHGWFNSEPHFQFCLEPMMKFLLKQLGTEIT